MKTLEQVLNSKEFKTALDDMILELKKHDGKTDWRNIQDDETTFNYDDGEHHESLVSIQLVPAWANLENIDSADLVELFNDYNDSDTPITDEKDADWKDLDIKVRSLDYDTMMDETLQVLFLNDDKEIQKLF